MTRLDAGANRDTNYRRKALFSRLIALHSILDPIRACEYSFFSGRDVRDLRSVIDWPRHQHRNHTGREWKKRNTPEGRSNARRTKFSNSIVDRTLINVSTVGVICSFRNSREDQFVWKDRRVGFGECKATTKDERINRQSSSVSDFQTREQQDQFARQGLHETSPIHSAVASALLTGSRTEDQLDEQPPLEWSRAERQTFPTTPRRGRQHNVRLAPPYHPHSYYVCSLCSPANPTAFGALRRRARCRLQ